MTTLADIQRAKDEGRRLVMVTAYDYPTARLVDEAGVDMILVGDSAAMVVLGHDATTAMDMDTAVLFTAAARRGASNALIIADMPFMSYQPSDEVAVTNAGRLIRAGADAVKVEGAGPTVGRTAAIAAAGIPVVAHVGLTPQSATQLGGYRAQARTASQGSALVDAALELQHAGAFCIVLEAVPSEVAERVTQRLSIPTIGIGAGSVTDGQVLVFHDLVGLTAGPLPRFVKQYDDLSERVVIAVRQFASEVRDGQYPSAEHTYPMQAGESETFASLG